MRKLEASSRRRHFGMASLVLERLGGCVGWLGRWRAWIEVLEVHCSETRGTGADESVCNRVRRNVRERGQISGGFCGQENARRIFVQVTPHQIRALHAATAANSPPQGKEWVCRRRVWIETWGELQQSKNVLAVSQGASINESNLNLYHTSSQAARNPPMSRLP